MINFSQLNEFLLAILLGVVQGVTEFLPISSTAHLRLITAYLVNGRDIGLTASNLIQFGTLLAILQFFKKDLYEYFFRIREILMSPNTRQEFLNNFKNWWSYYQPAEIQKGQDITKLEPKITNQTDLILAQLLVGSAPIILLGFVLSELAQTSRSLLEIALFLVVGSALMYFAERLHPLAKQKAKPQVMTPGEVLLIGFFQSLAAFPGISRSGATISGALILGRDRPKSVRFSFLLSIPALGLAGIVDIIKTAMYFVDNGLSFLPQASTWSSDYIRLSAISLLIAFILAYLVGLVVLKWLLKYLSTKTFSNFIVYRLILVAAIAASVYLVR